MPSLSSLLLQVVLPVLGVYIFTKGFFLTKQELSIFSECTPTSSSDLLRSKPFSLNDDELLSLQVAGVLSPPPPSPFSSDHPTSSSSFPAPSPVAYGCWQPRLVDKVFLIVVDALRFDFAEKHLPRTLEKVITKTTTFV